MNNNIQEYNEDFNFQIGAINYSSKNIKTLS